MLAHLVWSLLVLTPACKSGEVSAEKQQEAPATTASTKASTASAATTKATTREPKTIPAPPDVASAPKDATKTASGLATKVLTKGTGSAHPKPEDRVKVNYTGWTTDGKMFDSSVTRGTPATFGVSQVIKGWTEALQLMVAGEKRRVWIPADLAYGKTPRGGAPAGDLVFDVELLEIIEAPKPPPTPPDVKAPPATAKKTASGLRYKVLTPGKGDKPSATDVVRVHYSGWTTDGKLFDSSVMRGQPATFPLSGVIKGWTEGVQLMQVGEKTRFWIPADLAYGETPRRPGAPAGQLTFDIELLEILKRPPSPGAPGQKAAASPH